MLEELEHAQARGAKIYAEIVGFGIAGVPTAAGIARTIKNAVRD
jgi:3-oxoacyl-[acyl-carrier-protein] synthase II